MAYSYQQYNGDGSTTTFAIPFPYLDRAHIQVRVNSVLQTLTTHYTFPTSASVQFVSAPANGTVVEIRRVTPRNARLVDFQNGAKLTESVLDRDSDQCFYVSQEAFDDVASRLNVTAANTWDALGRRIVNVATPTSGTDAANADYVNSVAAGTLTVPLAVAQGGTGGTSPAEARAGIGMADVGKMNLLYNPGMRFLQNPTATSHNPAVTTPTYLFQRWYTHQMGGVLGNITTDQRTTGGPNGRYPMHARITRNTGASLTGCKFSQVLPTANSLEAAGQSMTIRFWARAGAGFPGASKLTVTLTAGTGTDQSAANGESGLWSGQTDVISQDVVLTTSWQEFSLTTVGLPAGTSQVRLGMWIQWTGTAVANDYVDLTGMRLVPSGSPDVPIIDYPSEIDEQRCLAFYETIGNGAVANAAVGSGKMTDADTGAVHIDFVRKRIPPVITISAVGHFYLSTQASNDTVTTFSVTAATLQRDRAVVAVDIGVARTAGDGCLLYGLNTSARVFINAEL